VRQPVHPDADGPVSSTTDVRINLLPFGYRYFYGLSAP
jgi:hypothetical protein